MLRIAPSAAPDAVSDNAEVTQESPEVMAPMMDMPMSGNVDPAVARYLGPESRCEGCVHFDGAGSCEIVAGQIDPQGVCSLFTPDTSMDMPMDDMDMEEPPAVEA